MEDARLKIHVTVDVNLKVPQLDYVLSGVFKKMSAQTDRLRAAVARTTSLKASIKTAFQTYAQRIRDANGDTAELDSIASELEGDNVDQQGLLDDIVANTPAESVPDAGTGTQDTGTAQDAGQP